LVLALGSVRIGKERRGNPPTRVLNDERFDGENQPIFPVPVFKPQQTRQITLSLAGKRSDKKSEVPSWKPRPEPVLALNSSVMG
jgi:hypothetical protein